LLDHLARRNPGFLDYLQCFPAARSTTHYDTYEYLPDDAATRRSLELVAPADTPVVVHPAGESPEPG